MVPCSLYSIAGRYNLVYVEYSIDVYLKHVTRAVKICGMSVILYVC